MRVHKSLKVLVCGALFASTLPGYSMVTGHRPSGDSFSESPYSPGAGPSNGHRNVDYFPIHPKEKERLEKASKGCLQERFEKEKQEWYETIWPQVIEPHLTTHRGRMLAIEVLQEKAAQESSWQQKILKDAITKIQAMDTDAS